jgi:hypothetical protein
MSDIFLRSLFPAPYRLPDRSAKYDQSILINWLEIEVDPLAIFKMPSLQELRGWRNREVFYHIRYVAPDWTTRMYAGACVLTSLHVAPPSQLKAKWQRRRITGPKIGLV